MANLDKKKIIGGGIIVAIIIIALVVYMTILRTFTVTFTLKIGAGIKTQEIKIGDKVIEPETPTADGYIFEGWYVNGEKYDFDAPVKSNLNLEAKWQKIADN